MVLHLADFNLPFDAIETFKSWCTSEADTYKQNYATAAESNLKRYTVVATAESVPDCLTPDDLDQGGTDPPTGLLRRLPQTQVTPSSLGGGEAVRHKLTAQVRDQLWAELLATT